MNIYDDDIYKVIEVSKEQLQNIDEKFCTNLNDFEKGIAYILSNDDNVKKITSFFNIEFDIIDFDYFKLMVVEIKYEYLKRCRELADKKPPEDIISTLTVHKSPAYIKLLVYAEQLEVKNKQIEQIANKRKNKIHELYRCIENRDTQEAYLLARLKEADEKIAAFETELI